MKANIRRLHFAITVNFDWQLFFWLYLWNHRNIMGKMNKIKILIFVFNGIELNGSKMKKS